MWLEERATAMAMHTASASFASGAPVAQQPKARKAKRTKKSAPPPRKKLRVLSLHGYGMNATAMQSKMGALRRTAKASAEFVFVEGPFVAAARDDDHAASASDAAETRSWWNFTQEEEGGAKYFGWEETRARVLAEATRNGPFDAVLGFSQGGSAAALLCAEGENSALWTPRKVQPSGAGMCCLPRAAIIFSGFLPRDSAFGAKLLARGGSGDGEVAAATGQEPTLPLIPVPSLHVMGESDEIISVARSRALAACFDAPEELLHEGGHMVPSFAAVRHAFKAFALAHAVALNDE